MKKILVQVIAIVLLVKAVSEGFVNLLVPVTAIARGPLYVQGEAALVSYPVVQTWFCILTLAVAPVHVQVLGDIVLMVLSVFPFMVSINAYVHRAIMEQTLADPVLSAQQKTFMETGTVVGVVLVLMSLLSQKGQQGRSLPIQIVSLTGVGNVKVVVLPIQTRRLGLMGGVAVGSITNVIEDTIKTMLGVISVHFVRITKPLSQVAQPVPVTAKSVLLTVIALPNATYPQIPAVQPSQTVPPITVIVNVPPAVITNNQTLPVPLV